MVMASVTEVVEIPIAGMTCDHCVGTVRTALESVPGVSAADVDLRRGRAAVTIDPELVDRARLKTAVEAAGYSVPDGTSSPSAPSKIVTIGPMPRREEARHPEEWNLAIGGMHCASCVGRVEEALAKVPGVREARVNLATERASVLVDTEVVSEGRLYQSVAAAGYSARRAELEIGAGAESLRRERAGSVAYWRNRLVVGVVLTLPLVALGYLPVDRWLGLHTPAGWLMLPLATALQVYLGSPYIVGAWTRLKQGTSNMDTLIALGTSTAYGYSLYQLLFGDAHHTHFLVEAACIALFLSVTLGPIVVYEARRFFSTQRNLETSGPTEH
jgi:P-type Cu+ transporter